MATTGNSNHLGNRLPGPAAGITSSNRGNRQPGPITTETITEVTFNNQGRVLQTATAAGATTIGITTDSVSVSNNNHSNNPLLSSH